MENKEKILEKIAEEIRECKKCPLWRNRKNAVPGEGNPDTVVMFIGEAPGRFEDLEGRPFVGAAGKLLTELLRNIGLTREEVYITNVVKCRPPGNRDPARDEIDKCSPYLDRQIEVIKPKVIVTLGRHSTLYLLGKTGRKHGKGILSLRGRLYTIHINRNPVTILPTLHPAAALYNPRLKTILEKDFDKLKEILKSISKPKKGLDAFF
ncbi:MAG: uracil-DNA glycosylase [Thermoproteales archaeon]|nr:uracil-DNA glycosylase [Thermoproteales archaeon]RLE63650.1 MAG: uracil-DNA glycosylase [Thermoprotei archaeon]